MVRLCPKWLTVLLPALLAGTLLASTSVLPTRRASADLRLGLQGAWRLNEASDVRYDYTANDLDLSDNNTVATTTGNIYATCADFEAGNSEFLTRSDNAALTFTTSFTLACWCRIEAKPGGSAMALMSKWDSAGTTEYLLFWKLSTDRFSINVGDSGGTTSLDASNLGSPSLETWYLVIAWYDGATLGIQVNGGTPSTTSYSATLNDGAANFALGAFYNTSATGFWDGEMQSAALWNRALSPGERLVLWNQNVGLKFEQW